MNKYKEKVFTHQISQVAYKFFSDIMNVSDTVTKLRDCNHISWLDGYCIKCGMDEVEANKDNEDLYDEVIDIYFKQFPVNDNHSNP